MNRIAYILMFLSMFLSAQDRVGIGTDSPATELDVNGNVIISELDDYRAGNYTLMWDKNSSRLVGKFVGEPFRRIELKVNCTSGQDWVYEFDTGISDQDYTLILVAANLRSEDYDNNLSYPQNLWTDSSKQQLFYGIRCNKYSDISVKDVKLYVSNNRWGIKADYRGGNPVLPNFREKENNGSFYWIFHMLLIPNAYIEDSRVGTASAIVPEVQDGTNFNVTWQGLSAVLKCMINESESDCESLINRDAYVGRPQ